jgi:hypothetical protein
MEIKFAFNITDKIMQYRPVFDDVENVVKNLVRGKKYGLNLDVIYVGWICVAPEYDQFFKPRRPKYYEYKETLVDGVSYTFENTLECEIKLDYNKVLGMPVIDLKKTIFNVMLSTFITVIKSSKKIKEFDLDEFIKDLNNFFN